MPAIKSEIDEAVEEGITIEYLVAPVRISRIGDSIKSVVAVRMELGERDESGRRSPVPIPGTEFEIAVDSVITAVAQRPDWAGLASFGQDGEWASLDNSDYDRARLWAGGDVTGPGIASAAVGHGRVAAERAHATLCGLPPPRPDTASDVLSADLNLDYYPSADRLTAPIADPASRVSNPDMEVGDTVSEEEFFVEAARCLSCGMCIGCGYCAMFCNAEGFAKVIEPRPGFHYVLMLDRCEACGKCIEVCPCGFLSLERDGRH
jgi:NADPH-dependent glutamate synthase beta subunit-like oxidoreductase